MPAFIKLCTCLLIFAVSTNSHYSVDDYARTESPDVLLPILNNSDKYCKAVGPGHLKGGPTIVQVGFWIKSLSSFKAQTMDFNVDMYLITSWNDTRLSHNKTDPVLITDRTTAKYMWQPDLYFVNSKRVADQQDKSEANLMIIIYPDGFIFKSIRVSKKIACMMDLSLFPFDHQTCEILVQSYAHPVQVLQLEWFKDETDETSKYPIAIESSIVVNDMIIDYEPSYKQTNVSYPMFKRKGVWSQLSGHIVMERLIMIYFSRYYVPTFLLVCISWLSFWLDIRAAPARIALSVTTLLTIVNVGNGLRAELPTVSYLKAIDVWLFACITFVFAVLLEYTMVNICMNANSNILTAICHCFCKCFGICSKYHRKHPSADDKEPTTSEHEGKCCAGLVRAFNRQDENTARHLDTVSRLLFPSAFFLFAAVYIGYFLVQRHAFHLETH